MTSENVRRGRDWYSAHRLHVNKMLAVNGPQVEPTGSDATRPELWKDIHWRWFMTGVVADQIGVNLKKR